MTRRESLNIQYACSVFKYFVQSTWNLQVWMLIVFDAGSSEWKEILLENRNKNSNNSKISRRT